MEKKLLWSNRYTFILATNAVGSWNIWKPYIVGHNGGSGFRIPMLYFACWFTHFIKLYIGQKSGQCN